LTERLAMGLGLDLRQPARLAVWALGGALCIGVFLVYLATLSPGALGGDPGELQFVPYILGMTHPTGMPLYVLAGKVWSSLPLGPSVAWRMSLLAAISASLAIAVVYASAYQLTQRLVPALGAALALAFGGTFWKLATTSDKYAFNALMAALVIFLVLYWGKTRSPAGLYLLAFTYGLSLTHHRTMLLFGPPLLLYVWWREKSGLWRDWRRLLRLALLFLSPLLLYLYVPWAERRDLPPGTWHPSSLIEWLRYFNPRGQVQHVRLGAAGMIERLSAYGSTLGHDFAPAGLLLGAAGLLWQFRRRTAEGLFLLVCFFLQAFLAANHDMHHRWLYFLPSFLIFSLWIGEGLGMISYGIERAGSRRPRVSSALAALVSLGLVVLLLVPIPAEYRPLREAHLGAGVMDNWRQALRDGYMADRLGSAIANLDPSAVVVADWEQAVPLWYYQQVLGKNPGVEIIYPITRLDEAAAMGRPLYIARTYDGLADRWHPSSVGPLIALNPEPARQLPADMQPLGAQVGDSLELAGFSYDQADPVAGAVVPLTLYWRTLAPPSADYSVSLRLYDDAGNEVFKVDNQNPVLGSYPTSRWGTGEVVADYYEIQLPFSPAPGSYHWGVVVYRALPEGGWENLRAAGSGTDMVPGGTIQVRARP
jgi:hypothetical protein